MSIDQQNPNSQSNAEDDLPDWLRELRGMAAREQPKSSTSSASDPTPPTKEDDLPDWLKEVQAEETDQPETSSFDIDVFDSEDDEDDGDDMWQQILAEEGDASDEESETLTATASLQTEAAKADDSDDGLDIWQQILAEEGLSLEELPEERPPGAEDMSLKDYLAATADESARTQAQAQTTAPPPEVKKPVETPKPSEPQKPVKKPEPVVAATPPQDDGMVVEDELPDWLREDQPVEASGSSLSWLTDESISDDEVEEIDEIEEEAEVESALLADDGMVVEDELPDWLREDQPVEAGGSSLSWLTDESISDDEVEEIDEIEEEAEVEPALLADDGMVVEDELPDWLREDQPVEAGGSSLSWLTDESLHDETDLASPEIASSMEDSFDDELLDTDVLPDWLQVEEEADDEVGSAEPEQAPVASQPTQPVSPDDGIVDIDGLPDWLRDEQDLEPEPSKETEQTVPSWLKDIVTDEAVDIGGPVAAEADTSVPDWLRDAEEVGDGLEDFEAAISDSLDAENLPDWLETSAGEPLDESLIDISDVAAEQAEVPSWLEKLRHGDEEADIETPAEVGSEEVVSATATFEKTVEEVLPKPELVEPVLASRQPLVAGEAKAKLSVARATLDAGELEDALEIYRDLLNEPIAVDEIIKSLSGALGKYKDEPAVYELLGDAQMRDGQLNRALESYRLALEKM